MDKAIEKDILDVFTTKIRPALDNGFEIYSFTMYKHSWSDEISLNACLLNNTPEKEEVFYERYYITVGKTYPGDILEETTELIKKYFNDADYLILKEQYDTSIVNIKYVKPSISGKYKTNIRITKPVKGINNYEHSYYFSRANISYAVGGVIYHKNKKDSIFRPIVTNAKYNKIIADIASKANEVIDNFNNIDIGNIMRFSVYNNRNNISIDNIRDEKGSGISLDMLPDPTIAIKKALECMTSDDFIYTTNGRTYINFKVLFSDDYTIKINNNYSGSKYAVFEHKNNIAANSISLVEEDFDNILQKPNIDPELEEKILEYKLLVML